MATIKRRGDGWFVQVRRKGYQAQYKTLPTKAEAEAWARQQETRIDSREVPTDLRCLRRTTLGDILTRYRNDVTPTKRGADSERLRLGKMLRHPMCAVSLADLSPTPIAHYRDERLKVVQPASVAKELALIRTALNVARREWGTGLASNPVDSVTKPVVRNARDRRLNPGELARLEEALRETRNPLIRPFMLFAIETALRRGEALKLEWRHIDLASRTAHIPETKNGRSRTIPLTDAAISILGTLPREGANVFPMTAVALRLAWDRLRERAGLPDLHIHDLRHEAISRFSEIGLTTVELAVISGHRDPRMLFRYAHLRPADLALKLAGKCWGTGL